MSFGAIAKVGGMRYPTSSSRKCDNPHALVNSSSPSTKALLSPSEIWLLSIRGSFWRRAFNAFPARCAEKSSVCTSPNSYVFALLAPALWPAFCRKQSRVCHFKGGIL